MKNLWAPWRMEFINDIRQDDGCFLCRVGGEAPRAEDDPTGADRRNLVPRRGERCFCVMNRFPYSNGHLLIAPYAHEADLDTLGEGTLLELMTMLRESKRVLSETVRAHGFNIGLNIGLDAGAGVADHMHFHIVPRWRGDTNFMPVIGRTKVIPQALEALYGRLKSRWDAMSAEA